MGDVSNSVVALQSVIGDGPFIHIGSPTALATSPDLIVVGGNLGWAQWNGRSVYDRSDRSVGWFPVGIYRANDLCCLRVLTSGWEVNAVAIHPAGRLIAIGTGAYDGGYAFEGELLLHDLELGTTTSVLTAHRTIEALEWQDSETLAAVVAPPTDEDVDWPHIVYETFEVRRQDWTRVDRRSVDLEAEPSAPTEAVEHDLSALKNELVVLSKRSGMAWQSRRQVWAVAPTAHGLVVGLESAIEAWNEQGNPLWRRAVDGACTQLLPRATGYVVASLWQAPETEFLTRPTVVVALDEVSGAGTPLLEPSHPAVLMTRSDGALLARDTQHGRSPQSAVVVSATGENLGHVELSTYDLFNHYFDIRRAPEFLVLVGDDPESWKNKRVAEVRRGFTGRWSVRDLFPLAWANQRHVLGGPGVFLDDATGRAVAHTGIVHDFAGLQRGSAFVVRRRYPDGKLVWHVALDNQVTALDESDGRIVVVTNLGELVMIDAASGDILGREERLAIDGHAVVPLSLAVEPRGRAWIGTLDGRVIQAILTNS